MKYSQVVLGSSIFLIGVLTSTGISYGTSKTDILKEVDDHVLSLDVGEDIWEIAHNKLIEFTKKSTIKDEGLKLISQETNDLLGLRKWCSYKYSSTFRSLFNKGNKEDLEEVKKWCYLTIEDVLSKDSLIKNKTVMDKYTWNLMYYLSKMDDKKTNDFDDEIKKIWEEVKSFEEDLEELIDEEITIEKIRKYKESAQKFLNWCYKTYNKKFVGKNDKDYKTTKEICVLKIED